MHVLILFLCYFLNSILAGHVCDRPCLQKTIQKPMTCVYSITVEEYQVLSRACYDCPRNVTDCFRPHCISGDGTIKGVTVVNRTIPAPLIAVCRHDTIVLDVENSAGVQALTIHFHGMNHELGTPYMDGVAYVTQCPILNNNFFRYKFVAQDVGTHFYHSHMGFQRAEGVSGFLIVRVPIEDEIHGNLYDYDLNEHAIMVQEWPQEDGVFIFNEANHAGRRPGPAMRSVLVNGRGRFTPVNISGQLYNTPLSTFNVNRGYRYRFRVCGNANYLCAHQFSIDNHTLTMIATDGHSIEPVTVDSFVLNPGERYDFILTTNQTIGTYWIKLHGVLACPFSFGSAILRYSGSNVVEPSSPITYSSTIRNGIVLNQPNSEGENIISVVELNSTEANDETLKTYPDMKFFISTNFEANRNPGFYHPTLYPWEAFPPSGQVQAALLNGIAFDIPQSPVLTQYNDIPPENFCNSTSLGRNCSNEFCSCVHRIRMPLGQVVELILFGTGSSLNVNLSHPMHLHGYRFRVVAQQTMLSGMTREQFLTMESNNQIERKLVAAPYKDTVAVPHIGYVILRIKATNPGFWLLHCHIEDHMGTGMMMLLQVGEVSDLPNIPKDFPKCGRYEPPY